MVTATLYFKSLDKVKAALRTYIVELSHRILHIPLITPIPEALQDMVAISTQEAVGEQVFTGMI